MDLDGRSSHEFAAAAVVAAAVVAAAVVAAAVVAAGVAAAVATAAVELESREGADDVAWDQSLLGRS